MDKRFTFMEDEVYTKGDYLGNGGIALVEAYVRLHYAQITFEKK